MNIQKMHWGTEPEFFGPFHEYRESLILDYFKKNQVSGKILDVGFGNGNLLIKLKEENMKLELYGIDNSDKFVDYCDKKIKKMKADNLIQIQKASAEKLPFPDNYFNAVICAEVLEHIKEDFRVFKEIQRVLKPNGICIISVPFSNWLWSKVDEWAGHYRRYSRKDIIRLFKFHKFMIKKITFWGFPLCFIYFKFIFPRIIKKEGLALKVKRNCLNNLIGIILKFDNLWGQVPFGIGIIAIGKK